MTNFIGLVFGLVTVVRRDEKGAACDGSIRLFAVCECGKARWFRHNNLRRAPPKTHKFCCRGIDLKVLA